MKLSGDLDRAAWFCETSHGPAEAARAFGVPPQLTLCSPTRGAGDSYFQLGKIDLPRCEAVETSEVRPSEIGYLHGNSALHTVKSERLGPQEPARDAPIADRSSTTVQADTSECGQCDRWERSRAETPRLGGSHEHGAWRRSFASLPARSTSANRSPTSTWQDALALAIVYGVWCGLWIRRL
jgi:hypothetical protein